MINVIHAGDASAFEYLLMPEQNSSTMSFIQNQVTKYNETLTDIGRSFMELSKDTYERLNDASVIRMAKAALRTAKGIFHPNVIVPLETIEELQAAQSMMQRYIMAQPDIRELYHQQRCDGYSDTYVDLHSSDVGSKHYDYRKVMTGIIVEEVDENGEDLWVSHNYIDDLEPGDKDLDFSEKLSILDTWQAVRRYIETKEDPTNMFGGSIG